MGLIKSINLSSLKAIIYGDEIMGSPELDRWVDTKGTEQIYEKYKVRSGITDYSTFKEELIANVMEKYPSLAKELTDERCRKLFDDYLGTNVEDLKEQLNEEKLSKEQVEEEMQKRLKELTKITEEKLFEEPIFFKQKAKSGKTYNRSFQRWTPQQLRWLQSRIKEKNNKDLTKEFNTHFKTFRPLNSIKRQKSRLRKQN